MQVIGHRRGLVVSGALLIVLILLAGVWLGPSKPSANLQDPSFHFTFCKVTRGTNHTVYSGIPPLGSLNRTLVRSGYRRLTRDQKYSWTTPTSTTCVSVGFRHSGEVLKKDPGNGLLYPQTTRLLNAVLVFQSGQTVALEFRGGGYGPYTEEFLNYWDVPSSVTNVLDCELQLSRKTDGADVATFQLQ